MSDFTPRLLADLFVYVQVAAKKEKKVRLF